MSCPNCSTEMKMMNQDNQPVLHCNNCGGSFFEENGINRISQDTASFLTLDKQTDDISGKEKNCPKDQNVLQPISTNFNEFQPMSSPIPPDVTLLQCKICKGIFVFPDDLLKFKKAQNVKVDYFKIWGIPLPSLKTVVVFSFVTVISLAVFSRFLLYQNGFLGQTQARDLIKNVSFSKSGRYGFISFKTTLPFKSSIVITDTKTGINFTKQISLKPTLLHYLTITNIPFADPLTYHIVLVDNNGKEVKTEERKLEVK